MNAKSKSKTAPATAPAPVEAAPVEAAPVEAAPVEAGPVEAGPVEAAPCLEIESIPGVPISGVRMGCDQTIAFMEPGAFLRDVRLICAELEIMGGAVLHRCAVEIKGPMEIRSADGRARLEYARRVGESFTTNRVDLKGSTLIVAGLTIAPRGWVANPAGILKPDPAYVRSALGAEPTGNPIKL